MTVFSCNNLKKSYGDKLLFESVSFGMEQGERIGLIGKNGAGKTTLLKILAGLDTPDDGTVVFNSSIKLEFLEQTPVFESNDIVIDAVLQSQSGLYSLLEKHRNLCSDLEKNYNKETAKKLEEVTQRIDSKNGWNIENEAKKILSILGVEEIYQPIRNLSGGLKKRVALAKALISNPELLIMDEPTNHLDADSVQWLQDRLMSSSNSILLVTHDRYFLDAVSTKIIEIE